MPQLVKKRRSGWALLAASAMVASLLAVAASPAGAGNGNGDLAPGEKPWNVGPVWPWTSACVGDALDDHMFADVSEGHAFTDAINCIAYYGITNGTGDGSTYSPNQDVSRAEMAVFIARAATAAGVDLGSGSGGYTDIGDVWQEAQDAINQLGAKGMIPAGGAFRPDDDITRAEMATFLFGLLLEASPLVSLADKDNANRPCSGVSETCEIRLGDGASAEPVNDWFPDARDSEPLEVDKHISAMWELGVTGGAEALPPGPGRPHVLVNVTTRSFIDGDNDPATALTPSPQATVLSPLPLMFDDDGKATFSVAGLPDGAPRFKTDKYDIDVSVLHFPESTALGPYPLAFNYDPSGTVNRGEMAAFITRALAHTTVRPSGVTAQYDDHDDNVVVSVRDDDFQPVSNTVVDVFYTDTPGVDLAFRGDGSCGEVDNLQGTYSCEIDKTDSITGGGGDTLLRLATPDLDAVNGTTVWVWTGDDEDQVDVDETELFKLDIPGGISEPAAMISVTNDHGGSKAHLGSSVTFTLQLRDKYGRATTKRYSDSLSFVDSSMRALAEPTAGTGVFTVLSGHETTAVNSGSFTGVFSTESSLASSVAATGAAPDVTVGVGPNPSYVAADSRGAATRVKVSVMDQYGDPLPGREVRLRTGRTEPEAQRASDRTDDGTDNPTHIAIANDAYLAVDRGGSYTFGYERTGLATAETDSLTADVEAWDHDGDGCTTALIGETGHSCNPDGTVNLGSQDAALITGMGSIQWASEATGTVAVADAKQILAIDTATNTIFVGTVTFSGTPEVATVGDASVEVIYYDANDRFNIDRPAVDGGTDPGPVAASYAGFERNLFNLRGFELHWDIVPNSGSRDVNEYTLVVAPDTDSTAGTGHNIDPIIYWAGR